MPSHTATRTKWKPATKEHPCPQCGKTDSCTIAPDGSAAKCWRNGGEVFQFPELKKDRPMNRTFKPADRPSSNGRAYPSADAAIESLAKIIPHTEIIRHVYTDSFIVLRFNQEGGEKQHRPIHKTAAGWKVGDPTGKLPLYRISEAPVGEPVIVTEGEKAADAGWSIGLPCVTSSHGSSSAAKSDWSEVAKRGAVAILPDNDEPGEHYAAAVAAEILALNPDAEIKIVRLPGLPEGGDIYEYIEHRDSMESEAIRQSVIDLIAQAEATKSDEPQIVGAIDLMQNFPDYRPSLVEGLLRETETMNIIAPPKSHKTYTAMQLGLCIATGRMWMGTYPVKAGPVLYVDCELHPNTFARRLHSVSFGMGIMKDHIAGRFDVMNLRGKLKDLYALAPMFAAIPHGKYKLIVLDALYRLLPDDVDENSNSDVVKLYNRLDNYAEMTGAAFAVIHHSSKGIQGSKAVTDVGAGAGAQSRAADSHLIIRAHEVDGAVVIEAANRSFPPIEPKCFRWEYPIWKAADDLDPTQLKVDRPGRKRKEDTPAVEPEKPWTVDRFIGEFITGNPRTLDSITVAADAHKLSERKVKQLLNAAVEDGTVYRWTFRGKGGDKFSTDPQPLIGGDNEG